MGRQRDPEKQRYGEILTHLKKHDKEKLAEIIASLSEREAEELMYDDEIWLRSSQWIDLDADHQLTLICAGRGFGKDLDVNTPVLTYNRGWTILDDVQVGDYVFNEKGEPVEVLDKYYPEVKRDCYEIEFNDDSTIVASSDHEWHVVRNSFVTALKRSIKTKDMFHLSEDWAELGLGEIKTTQELIEEFFDKKVIPNWCIPKNAPLKYEKYVPIGRKWVYRRATPEDYENIMTACVKSRLGFLRCIHTRKGELMAAQKRIRATFDTDWEKDAYVKLLRTLGITRVKVSKPGGPFRKRVRWFVYHKPHNCNTLTTHDIRTYQRLEITNIINFERYFKRMVGYKKVEWRPTACLSVSGPSSLWLAGTHLTPTHNTRTMASTVKRLVEDYGVKKITIIAATARDLRHTIAPAIDGVYGPSHPNKPKYSSAKSNIEWPNGAMAILISAEAGEDAPRGTQCEALMLDEAAFYDNNEGIITQALLTCRLGMSKAFAFTTPKATKQMIEWLRRAKDGDPSIKLITGSTMENADNLSKTFTDTVVSKYKGTRLERVELHGELILEAEGALLTMDIIERNTIGKFDLPRIVQYAIGVDVALTSKATAAKGRRPDSTGIVVVGKGEDETIYTINALTGVYSVEKWTEKLSLLYNQLSKKAPTTIGVEQNAGGVELLSSAISKVDRDLLQHIKFSWSGQGKMQRASPYTLMVEQGRIKFVDDVSLQPLTDELISYTGSGKSPDNMDAWTEACKLIVPHKNRVTKSFELIA